MKLKASVLWGLLAIGSLGMVAGCNPPNSAPKGDKPASAEPAAPANTTDSK